MTGQLELISRAELCRQLAKLEPANRILWMAEAENWSRMSEDKFREIRNTAPPPGSLPANIWPL